MTPTTTTTPILASKYAMKPTPESVSRLGALVAVRGGEFDQIAKLIAADRALTVRLLGDDVPATGAADEIERQIFRLGIEPILVLAMSEPLVNAVHRTFETMTGIALEIVEIDETTDSDELLFTSSLSISGRANGRVYLRLGEDFNRALAAKVLGIAAADANAADLRDVLAELSNMTVGSFQSNLCDAGLTCKLSVPEVSSGAVFAPPKVPRGRHRTFGFRHDGMLLLVDILVQFAG